MLLCGFEKFDNIFVRIDMLERLFMIIMRTSDENSKEIKLVPEMLNLLGCTKENFLKLIKKMDYSYYQKNDQTYLRYSPIKNFKKSFSSKTPAKENPFSVLKNIKLNNV